MDHQKQFSSSTGDTEFDTDPKPFTIQFITSPSSSSSISTEIQKEIGEREPMFSKVLTPSDVGKLNRLVIPKQQAERYLPLLGLSSPYKGAELLFVDRVGMQWHFRYFLKLNLMKTIVSTHTLMKFPLGNLIWCIHFWRVQHYLLNWNYMHKVYNIHLVELLTTLPFVEIWDYGIVKTTTPN